MVSYCPLKFDGDLTSPIDRSPSAHEPTVVLFYHGDKFRHVGNCVDYSLSDSTQTGPQSDDLSPSLHHDQLSYSATISRPHPNILLIGVLIPPILVAFSSPKSIPHVLNLEARKYCLVHRREP
jgi:hypothetical protein